MPRREKVVRGKGKVKEKGHVKVKAVQGVKVEWVEWVEWVDLTAHVRLAKLSWTVAVEIAGH